MPPSALGIPPPNKQKPSIISRRSEENAVIKERVAKFRQILKIRGRSLKSEDKAELESLAFAWLSSSVHLHLEKWRSGANEPLLNVIAKNAFYRVLRKKTSRDGLLGEMRAIYGV